MDYKKRWLVVEEKGKGGQGTVYKVLDKSLFDFHKINLAVADVSSTSLYTGEKEQLQQITPFREAVREVVRMEAPESHGALKVLLPSEQAKDPSRAKDRIEREIEAMSKLSHDNLLKILDTDPDSEWFVSEFHSNGSLRSKNPFVGNPIGALRAFKPLVDGVAKLHKRGLIHRDIKPHNVFVANDGRLVLGDFGIVFSQFEEDTRLSDIADNVGSRDWMPGWAMARRIEELSPAFDVFSLGKLLWAMISGKPVLPLWYHKDPAFDLVQQFPKAPHIELVDRLLSKCIVEREEDCVSSAGELLIHINDTLTIIDSDAGLVGPKVQRKCRVCGLGRYALYADREDTAGKGNFGLQGGPVEFKIFVCDNCGHSQLFAFQRGLDLQAWKEKS